METPVEVQKAMRLIKAWNAFKKEAENGVTNGAQFTMEGANDSEGEKPAVAQQDANDLVDEEYTEALAPSAIDETGLAAKDAEADEDMTVDSADAVETVSVGKSARRLARKLMRKAEEANPEMTEEEKDETEDAIADDLKDPEATQEIAECMKAEGDEELADELENHAELLTEEAKKSIVRKDGGDVGAVALPEEQVGVATEKAEDKAGEQNDTDMPPSAVDEAGTDKIDTNGDLEDNEVAKVDDEPEKENPGYVLPEDDVPNQAKTVSGKSEAEDKELAKAYRMMGIHKNGMSITDMIAAKRGERIEEEEGSIEVFKPTSAGPRGYRPVELGRGKTMIPPFKH